MMFDLEKIRSQTDVATLDFLAQTTSTNDRAIELARQNRLSCPALVLTESQTSGRGQRDRKWWSGEGSLTFSWVMSMPRPREKNIAGVSLLPMTVALAVAEALERSTALSNVRIKWPNDLIVVDRKISGILIETVSLETETVIVVGIGINVNNPQLSPRLIENSKHSTSYPPTSVLIETHNETSLEHLLIAILQGLSTEFETLANRPVSIIQRCDQRLLFRDEAIQVTQPDGQHWRGICQGISSEGGLILRTINGIEVIFSGTINAV